MHKKILVLMIVVLGYFGLEGKEANYKAEGPQIQEKVLNERQNYFLQET